MVHSVVLFVGEAFDSLPRVKGALVVGNRHPDTTCRRQWKLIPLSYEVSLVVSFDTTYGKISFRCVHHTSGLATLHAHDITRRAFCFPPVCPSVFVSSPVPLMGL